LKVRRTKSKDMTQPAALYIGADVHERESQLAIFEPSGTLLTEKRLPTTNLPTFIDSLPGEKHVAIESTGFIYPIYDKLSTLKSCHVSVAHPNKVKLIAKSKLKHDRADAKILGELLRTNYLPASYMPPPDTREKRLLINDRVRYGLRSGELKGSIRWLLKRRGIQIQHTFKPEGKRKLRELDLQEINIRLDELELIEAIIRKLNGQIAKIVQEDPNAKLLDTLPGVAPYTALFLSSEIGDVNRFPDSKHLCAYVGLVPSLHQSGDITVTGHITREGNKWLRRNLTECSRVAVRKDPHLRAFYLKLTHTRGEKKAILAIARKLVAYAYWMLKRNQTYEELSPWDGS
jgi:transposase